MFVILWWYQANDVVIFPSNADDASIILRKYQTCGPASKVERQSNGLQSPLIYWPLRTTMIDNNVILTPDLLVTITEVYNLRREEVLSGVRSYINDCLHNHQVLPHGFFQLQRNIGMKLHFLFYCIFFHVFRNWTGLWNFNLTWVFYEGRRNAWLMVCY